MRRGVTLVAYLAAIGAGTAASVQLWMNAFADSESIGAPELGLPGAQARGVPAVVVPASGAPARLVVVRTPEAPTNQPVSTLFLPGLAPVPSSSPGEPTPGPGPTVPPTGAPQPNPGPGPQTPPPPTTEPEPTVVDTPLASAPVGGSTPTVSPPAPGGGCQSAPACQEACEARSARQGQGTFEGTCDSGSAGVAVTSTGGAARDPRRAGCATLEAGARAAGKVEARKGAEDEQVVQAQRAARRARPRRHNTRAGGAGARQEARGQQPRQRPWQRARKVGG